MKNLLSIQEVSKILGLKIPTIYKFICLRKIPFIKLGRRVFFDSDKLDKWVKSNSYEPIYPNKTKK